MWVSKEDIRVLITRHVLKGHDRRGIRTNGSLDPFGPVEPKHRTLPSDATNGTPDAAHWRYGYFSRRIPVDRARNLRSAVSKTGPRALAMPATGTPIAPRI